MEKKEEIDEDKLKVALEKVKGIDIDRLMKAFVDMLKAYAQLAKRVGTIQRDNEEAFESLTYLGSMAPQIVQMLAKKAPPAEFGAFIKAFMELLELAPKLDNIMKLSAEEKIEVGNKLENIANTLEQMISKVKEEESGGEKTDV
jgi:hypothetical protein